MNLENIARVIHCTCGRYVPAEYQEKRKLRINRYVGRTRICTFLGTAQSMKHFSLLSQRVFLFLYYFFRFIKNICRDIFFSKMSPSRQFIRRNVVTAGWTGGRLVPPWAVVGRILPPVETAVGGTYCPPRPTTAHGGTNQLPVHPAVTTFRRMNRRLGDIFENKKQDIYFW